MSLSAHVKNRAFQIGSVAVVFDTERFQLYLSIYLHFSLELPSDK